MIDLCIEATKGIKSFRQPVTANDSVFGDGCQLDSLDFVDYCLAIEKLVHDRIGATIKLVDPQLFLFAEGSPYRTVSGMAELVSSLVGPLTPAGEKALKPAPLGTPKVVLTDLDGTVWSGVAGEDSLSALPLLYHLYSLEKAGVVIGAITKSHQQVITESGIEVDWKRFAVRMYGVIDKADAVREALSHLGLSERDCIYIDDQPYERARVIESIPTIRAVSTPAQALSIPVPANPTAEDRVRTEMYVQEYDRRKSGVGKDFSTWLESLHMVIKIAKPRTQEEKSRALQLLERSNQFNLVKRPEYILEPDQHEYVVSLTDRFGDCGIIAVMRTRGECLTDFAVSCRVLGRGIEETLVKWVRSKGVKQISIQINDRNLAAQEFMARYRGLGREIDQTSFPITILEDLT